MAADLALLQACVLPSELALQERFNRAITPIRRKTSVLRCMKWCAQFKASRVACWVGKAFCVSMCIRIKVHSMSWRMQGSCLPGINLYSGLLYAFVHTVVGVSGLVLPHTWTKKSYKSWKKPKQSHSYLLREQQRKVAYLTSFKS